MSRLLLLSIAVMSVGSQLPAAILNTQVSGFDDTEQRVLTHVTRFWSEIIADPITVNISLVMRDLAGDLLGSSFGFVQDARGLPKEATVEIDTREGAVFGWFVDPTPDSAEEFVVGSTPWHYQGKLGSVAGQQYDLLTVLHHEFAHVLGFTTAYSRFASRVQSSDNISLRYYNGRDVDATLAPAYEGTHLSDDSHRHDLMTAFQGRGERMLPSHLDLALLRDAYGYSTDGGGGQIVPEPVLTFVVGIALLCVVFAKRSKDSGFRALGCIRAEPICRDKEQG